MSRALRYFMNRELARGWAGWQTAWAEQNAKCESMRKSLSHMLNRGLSRGFGAWLEMAIERAVFLQKLRKGVSRMVNRKLAFGFDRWNAAFAPRDDPMSKALLYFLNRELARGWVAWYTTWEELKAKRNSMRRSLSHLINRGLSRGFGAWLEMVAERVAALKLMRKGVSFMLNRRLGAGLGSWLGWMDDQQRHARGRGSMGRALLHLKNRGLSRGWMAWHANWAAARAKSKAKHDTMRKALGHLTNRGLSRGWGAWTEMLEERKAFLQLLRKGLSFMLHREVARALKKWATRAAFSSYALSRWYDGPSQEEVVQAAWNKWLKYLIYEARLQLGAVAGLANTKRGALTRALRRWRPLVHSRSASLMQRARWHLLNRELSRGFRAWLAMAIGRVRLIQNLRWGLSRMRTRKLSLGFASWRAACAPREGGYLTSKALRHFMYRGLSNGWNAWQSKWAALTAKRELLLKSLGHFLKKGLARGFGAWLEMADQRYAALDLMSKGADFLANRGGRRQLFSAFIWLAERADTMRLVAAVIGRLQMSIQRRLQEKWTLWLERVVEGVQTQQYSDMLLRKALFYMVNQKLAKGFSRWVRGTVGIGREDQLRRKAAGFFRHREFARALSMWRGVLVGRDATDALMRRALGFMRYREQAAAVTHWIAGLDPSASKKSAASRKKRALMYMLKREKARVWKRWRAVAEVRARGLLLIRKGAGYLLHRGLGRGLAQWRRRAQRSTDAMWARAKFCWQANATVHAFHVWRARQQELDEIMKLTFASAASFLPIPREAKQPPLALLADGKEGRGVAITASPPARRPPLPPGAEGRKKTAAGPVAAAPAPTGAETRLAPLSPSRPGPMLRNSPGGSPGRNGSPARPASRPRMVFH